MVGLSSVAADESLVATLKLSSTRRSGRRPSVGVTWGSVDRSIGTSFRMGGNPPELKPRVVLFAVNILRV